MPTFLGHEACPECRKRGNDTSGDNLGRYSDGSAYCYSCTYKESGDSLSLDALVSRVSQQQKQKDQKDGSVVSLPSDYSRNIPDEALDWLRFYEITDAEIDKERIGWSSKLERIIFPCYETSPRGDSELIMWQGRRLASGTGPKAITEGFKEKCYHICGNMSVDSICIVEDILSCIKVARVMPAMPLWGSVLSTKRLVTLSDDLQYKELLIWLDPDKLEYAAKRAVYARPFFEWTVRVIASNYDPKMYSTEEIQKYVTARSN